MRQFNVLFGFAQEKTEETIIRSLNAMGMSVMATKKTKKGEIISYLKENPNTDAVILKEYLDGGGELGAQDLIELSDDNSVNFVIVLDAKHRGRDEMKDIYAAGILNACFSDNKYGVNADELAKLAVRGRTHKEAREYYRIDQTRANHRFLSYTEFKELYSFLLDEREGLNISDRFITLSRWIDEEQLGSFVKMLPKETKMELSQYKEFVEINNRLFRLRYVDDKYSINSRTKDGLNRKEIANKMLDESGERTMKLPEPGALATGDSESDIEKEGPVEEQKTSEPELEDDLRSMAMKAWIEMDNAPKEEHPEGAASDTEGADGNEKAQDEPLGEVKKSPLSNLRRKLFGRGSGNNAVIAEQDPQSETVSEESAVDEPEEAVEPVVKVDTAEEVADESAEPEQEKPAETIRSGKELEKAIRDNALMKEELSLLKKRVDSYISEQDKKEKERAEKRVEEPFVAVKKDKAEKPEQRMEKPKRASADPQKKEDRAQKAVSDKRIAPDNNKPRKENEDKKPDIVKESAQVKKDVPNNSAPVRKDNASVNKPVKQEKEIARDKPKNPQKKAPVKDKGQRDGGKTPVKKKDEHAHIKGQLSFDDVLNLYA